MVPACSLVRGTRTRQPNSGLVSNQDSSSRKATVLPTMASSGLASRAALAALAAATSVAVTVRCSIVVPCWSARPGSARHGRRPAGRPARRSRRPAYPAGPPSRRRPPVGDVDSGLGRVDHVDRAGLGIGQRHPGVGRHGARSPRRPARSRTAPRPCRQATASSARPLKLAPSPSISRTTWADALAALTTSLARVARVRGWPSSPKPASSTSTSGAGLAGDRPRAGAGRGRRVGRGDQVDGPHGQQPEVSGAGADEADGPGPGERSCVAGWGAWGSRDTLRCSAGGWRGRTCLPPWRGSMLDATDG